MLTEANMEKIWLKHYQAGVPAEINPDRYSSLLELFQVSFRKFAELPAMSNLGSRLTYRELATLSQAFAAYLQKVLGCKKGDRIAIMLPNVLQYPVVLFAALQAGLIIVNTNPLYTVPEVVHQLNDAGVETVVVLANFAHVIEKALPQLSVKNVIVTELGDLFSWPKSCLTNWVVKFIKRKVPAWSIPNAINFKKMLAQGNTLTFDPIVVSNTDIAFLQYTGGTTGVPKAAMLSHRNILANVEQLRAWITPTLEETKEIAITALPLYHVFSLTVNLLGLFSFGALNILITNPRDIPALVKELTKSQFTVIPGVNTLFNALLNNVDFVKLNFSKLKIALGGGAAVQHAVAQRWQQVTGKVLQEGYGLTETSPIVSICPFDLNSYKNSIGLPVSSTDVIFLDDHDQAVALGGVGELCIKGPQVMQGYWHNTAETQKVFTQDGWLRTGDIGRMDEQGFIYLLERKKDMILVSGFNVYPNEVEDVIAEHPGVKEVAVIGVPDEQTGEAVKVFVVKKDPTLTAEQIQLFCRDKLTAYKRPKFIEFRESLPKSPVGKILRRTLRDNL
jgi:long-chain acyl-CoA synthetase